MWAAQPETNLAVSLVSAGPVDLAQLNLFYGTAHEYFTAVAEKLAALAQTIVSLGIAWSGQSVEINRPQALRY